MNAIKRFASDDAHEIFGTAYDETLGDPLRVTVIATGLSGARKSMPAPPLTVVQQPTMHAVQQPALRTGLDDIPVTGN